MDLVLKFTLSGKDKRRFYDLFIIIIQDPSTTSPPIKDSWAC